MIYKIGAKYQDKYLITWQLMDANKKKVSLRKIGTSEGKEFSKEEFEKDFKKVN